MLERLRKNGDGEGGFTLIELLIVITILGVLAAIVVFAVGSATSDSKKSACGSDRKAVEVALEAYKARNGVYPTGADQTAVLGVLTGGTNGGPFLKSAPTSTDWTITIGGGGTPNGTVTGALSAANGGGAC